MVISPCPANPAYSRRLRRLGSIIPNLLRRKFFIVRHGPHDFAAFKRMSSGKIRRPAGGPVSPRSSTLLGVFTLEVFTSEKCRRSCQRTKTATHDGRLRLL
jgi:hypothetical protein